MFGGAPSIGCNRVRRAESRRGHALQQAESVRMPRRAEQLLGTHRLDEHSAVHHIDALAHPGDDAQVVGDQDQRGVSSATSARSRSRI